MYLAMLQGCDDNMPSRGGAKSDVQWKGREGDGIVTASIGDYL